jgi:hypothetical protein
MERAVLSVAVIFATDTGASPAVAQNETQWFTVHKIAGLGGNKEIRLQQGGKSILLLLESWIFGNLQAVAHEMLDDA